jgi:hypothetical protein
MFQTHVSSVSSIFRRMLHMFRLDVSKVDRVLRGAVAGGERPAAGIWLLPHAFLEEWGGARHCRGGAAVAGRRGSVSGDGDVDRSVHSPLLCFLVELSPCVTLAGIIGFCWTPVGSPSPCIDSRLAGGSLLGPGALLGPDVRALVPSIINTN